MNDFCFDLEFPFEPLTIVEKESLFKTRFSKLVVENYFSSDLLDLMSDLGLDIFAGEGFYSKPFLRSQIHIDNSKKDISKMNFQIFGKKSKMCWYSEKENIRTETVRDPIIGPYIMYDNEDVTLVHCQEIKYPSIVQVGIPHNSLNNVEDRWVLCLNYYFKNTNIVRPTMDEARNIFSKYIR
jgi:hypothetical protein